MSRWRNAIGVATCAGWQFEICFAWPWAGPGEVYVYIIVYIYIISLMNIIYIYDNMHVGTHGRHKYYDMKCKPKLQASCFKIQTMV